MCFYCWNFAQQWVHGWTVEIKKRNRKLRHCVLYKPGLIYVEHVDWADIWGTPESWCLVTTLEEFHSEELWRVRWRTVLLSSIWTEPEAVYYCSLYSVIGWTSLHLGFDSVHFLLSYFTGGKICYLTSWSTFLPEQLIVARLLRKLDDFHKMVRFMTVFTSFWASWWQPTLTPYCLTHISVISSLVYLDLPNHVSPSDAPTILNSYLICTIRAIFSTHPVSFDLPTQLSVNYIKHFRDMFCCTEAKARFWLNVMKPN